METDTEKDASKVNNSKNILKNIVIITIFGVIVYKIKSNIPPASGAYIPANASLYVSR